MNPNHYSWLIMNVGKEKDKYYSSEQTHLTAKFFWEGE